MPSLNADLSFEDAQNHVKRAFLRTAEKVRIPPRKQLYKWTNRPLLGTHGISPWWSFVESTRLPSGAMAEGFRVAEERAARLGKTHREYARVRAAISDQFENSMSDLLVVTLNEEVWAFAGQASGQREFKDELEDLRNVILIGGAWQVWVPGLTLRHVTALPVKG